MCAELPRDWVLDLDIKLREGRPLLRAVVHAGSQVPLQLHWIFSYLSNIKGRASPLLRVGSPDLYHRMDCYHLCSSSVEVFQQGYRLGLHLVRLDSWID